eukprot:75953-Rhodomonas_salina.2
MLLPGGSAALAISLSLLGVAAVSAYALPMRRPAATRSYCTPLSAYARAVLRNQTRAAAFCTEKGAAWSGIRRLGNAGY